MAKKNVDIKVYGTEVVRDKARVKLEKQGLSEDAIQAELDKTFKGVILEDDIDFNDPDEVNELLADGAELWNADSKKVFIQRINKHLCDKLRAAYHRSASGKPTTKQIQNFLLFATADDLAEFQKLKDVDEDEAWNLIRSYA